MRLCSRHAFQAQPLRSMAVLAALIGAALALPGTARAGLGGNAASVANDRAALRGQLVSTLRQQYDVHRITTPTGTTVREYVTRQGTVFAVTWEGATPPDLKQLFGSYFPRYVKAAAAASHGAPGLRRQLVVNQSDFVVQVSGHLRHFQGRAYIPGLIPAGVSPSDIH